MAQPQVPEVPRLPVRPPVEDFDVSARTDVAKLRKGAIGLGGVLFLTVTGSAPISAMLFNTPIVVGFGQGVGAPAAFMFATIGTPSNTAMPPSCGSSSAPVSSGPTW